MNLRNRIGGIGLLIIGTAILAGCVTGCITTPSGKTIVDPAITESVAQEAAQFTATALDGKYHGELLLTFKALDTFVAAGGGTVAQLQSALSNLPVSALQGTNGAVLQQNGALVIRQGAQLLLKLDKSEIGQDYVLPIARGLRDGLATALGVTPGAQTMLELQLRAELMARVERDLRVPAK